MASKMRRGRPGRYAVYEQLEAQLPRVMTKRPMYVNGVGLFRGERGTTAWVKISLRHATVYRGKAYAAGKAIEIKLGAQVSWGWPALTAERDRLQGLADRGEPLEAVPTITFSSHAADWLAQKKSTMKGWDIAAGHVRKHLNPTFGAKPLGDITLADVNRWVARQRETCLPATVKRQVSTLNSILNSAVKVGLVEKNPTVHAEPIKGAVSRQRVLSADELATVLEAADKLEAEIVQSNRSQEIKGWLRDLVLWALHSGMRRGEILRLRWSDIESLDDGQTVVLIEKTKSGLPRRVTATEGMLDILGRLRGLPRAVGDDRLFPVSLTTAKRKLTKLWKSCGLEDVRLHDLRRTHASRLVRAGVDLKTLAGRLGHRDLKMLSETYAVYLGDADAASKAQAAFGSL